MAVAISGITPGASPRKRAGHSLRRRSKRASISSTPQTAIHSATVKKSSSGRLDAANAVMARASVGFAKTLTSSKPSAELPYLVTVEDETAQAVFIAGQVLEQREAGIELHRQSVLFRAANHSARLEIELARRNIP